MSKEIKKSLVPKLRFPEFRDAGEWDIDEIKNVCLITTGDKNTQDRKDSGRYPFFIRSQQIEKIDTYSFDGEAVLTTGDGVGVGKIFHYINGKFAFHQRVYKMSNFSNRMDGFYFYKYFSRHFYSRVMSMNAKTTVDSVRMEMISDMQILLPGIKEQKAIADCLSSVDELITAQTQKIDALKAHKKGMMQKLFPAEGETLPKLRFPEFRDAGEWEETKLGKLAKRITLKNKEGKVTQVLSNSAAYGVINQRDYFYKDIANAGNLSGYFVVEQGDYIYNARTSTIAPAGPISKNKIGTGIVSPLYTVFRFKDSNNDFYEQYFKSTYWHQYMRMISNSGARHSRMSFSSNDFMEMPLPDPCLKEQQKIADCLSSVDELITAQTQKIDALKAHKKGMMQKLFPSHDEMNR